VSLEGGGAVLEGEGVFLDFPRGGGVALEGDASLDVEGVATEGGGVALEGEDFALEGEGVFFARGPGDTSLEEGGVALEGGVMESASLSCVSTAEKGVDNDVMDNGRFVNHSCTEK
jgi:hypothetical protein